MWTQDSRSLGFDDHGCLFREQTIQGSEYEPIARPIVNEGFSILALSDVLVVLGSWRIDDLILSHASEHGLSLQLNRDRNAKG